MSVEYFRDYDRVSRGRRLIMTIVEGTQRRLLRSQPIDWERVHRHFMLADPHMKKPPSVQELRVLLITSIAKHLGVDEVAP